MKDTECGPSDDTASLSVFAHAKINLFLEILGKRDDGFHDIATVMQEISLADRLTATPAEDGVLSVTSTDRDVPPGEDNLVFRAARALQEEIGAQKGIAFHLEKRIPMAAGLGGGSADAAAALVLANRVWKAGLDREGLRAIGAGIGSDVPFFLWGGTCLCEGRGERVTPLPASPAMSVLLVLPPWGVSTAAAYGAADAEAIRPRNVDGMVRAIREGKPSAVQAESFNRFEEVLEQAEPRQAELLNALRDGEPGCIRLSGSGSAVWCCPRDAGAAAALRERATARGCAVWDGQTISRASVP